MVQESTLTISLPMKPQTLKQGLKFLFVGRLLYDKGIIEFIEAAEIIKATYPKTTFQVVGELDTQNPSAISEVQLSQWQKVGIIQYKGKVQDIKPLIALADVLVLPSYREGLPRVMLEGMSMAKPLITTDVPGCRETVTNGKNGFIVPPKDTIKLAQAMEVLLSLSSTDRQKMGKEGRKMAIEKFDEQKIVQTYVQHIETLAQKQIIKKWSPQRSPIFAFLRSFLFFLFIVVYLCFGALNSQAQTGTSNVQMGTTLFGYHGNSITPSAYLHADKTLNIGLSHLPPEVPFQGLGAANSKGGRLLFANLTFLPFLEITFGFNKPYTAEDPTDIGLGDRQISGRLQILREQKYLPAIVIGMHDPLTHNSHANTNYIVASKKMYLQKDLCLMTNAGYGFKIKEAEGHYLLGVFGAAAIQWKFLNASIEYDAERINVGLKANFKNRVFLQAALLDLQYLSATVNVRFELGKK